MKILVYPVLLFWFVCPALAESPSRDWSGSYNFPSNGSSTFRLLQADLIEKKDGGYYDSFGPASLSVFSTNTVGTLNNYTTNIDGEDNTVVNDSTSTNSGNLYGSISLIESSTINSNDILNSTVNNNEALIDD
jgi:hypothetical protein